MTETTEPMADADPIPLTEPSPGSNDATAEIPQSDEPETFSRDYVDQLRKESGDHRMKAKRVDEANARLVRAYVAADARLVDADDLPYSEDLLDEQGLVDGKRVAAAVAALVEAKPYLARRTPTTPISQGVREEAPAPVGIFSLMRGE